MSEPEVRVVFMNAEEIAVCEQLIAHSNSFTLFFPLLRRQDEIVWMDMEKTWLTYFIQEQIHESFSGNLCSFLWEKNKTYIILTLGKQVLSKELKILVYPAHNISHNGITALLYNTSTHLYINCKILQQSYRNKRQRFCRGDLNVSI